MIFVKIILKSDNFASAMPDQFFEHKEFRLHYKSFGRGSQTMLAFHGFGQSADVFECLTPSLGEKFSIISINIFFHKESSFPKHRIENQPLLKQELWDLFDAFLRHLNVNRFSVIGYSLGGKISLNLLEHFHYQIDNFILVAPDGMKIYPLNYLGTRSEALQAIYKRIIERPGKLFTIMKWLNKTGLLKSKTYEFFHFQLSEKWRRQLTFDVWMSLKLMMPEHKKIKAILNTHPIRFIMIFGKYDSIITSKVGLEFIKGIHKVEFIEVEAGHNLITEKLNSTLSTIFK